MENEKIFADVQYAEEKNYPNLRAHANITLQLNNDEFIRIMGFSIWEGENSNRPKITPPIIKDCKMFQASEKLWKAILLKIKNEYLKKFNS